LASHFKRPFKPKVVVHQRFGDPIGGNIISDAATGNG
jgi:hypothetical protein